MDVLDALKDALAALDEAEEEMSLGPLPTPGATDVSSQVDDHGADSPALVPFPSLEDTFDGFLTPFPSRPPSPTPPPPPAPASNAALQATSPRSPHPSSSPPAPAPHGDMGTSIAPASPASSPPDKLTREQIRKKRYKAERRRDKRSKERDSVFAGRVKSSASGLLSIVKVIKTDVVATKLSIAKGGYVGKRDPTLKAQGVWTLDRVREEGIPIQRWDGK